MNKKRDKRPQLEHWQIIAIFLMVYDFLAVVAAYGLALWLRFDGHFKSIPHQYWDPYTRIILPYAVFCILVFWLFRMYRSMWRFASFVELERTFTASLLTSVLHTAAITLLFQRMPISYYVLGMFFQFTFLIFIRFVYRFFQLLRSRLSADSQADSSRVMLIGAGQAGQMILRDTQQAHESTDRIVCIIDDNSNKWGRYIDGVPIVGGCDSILENVEKYHIQKIFVAVPSATAEQKRDILEICKETDCALKNLPSMYQFAHEAISVGELQDVSMEDLLGREPIRADMDEVYAFITGKVVLVTGGGGSIGSELCRQIASHRPKQLIIFDIYENNAYAIQLELRKKFPDLNLAVLIGSVRDSRRMFQVFEEYKPQIVYHAAAHKHVPLMEDSPCEAIKNNAIGTYKTAYAAMVHGCDKFVLISTDKAVNPTNIMGASKRLCEMIIQSFDQKTKEGKAGEIAQLFTHWGDETAGSEKQPFDLSAAHTEFVAVRFGNVLGSNGSVIPIFKQQIEEGGPVTVTHPDIIRYFMTVPEAVSLVMLAGTYAHGGEIFVLDMGSPVKIDTLARNLIRLSGFKPDVDIKIEYTGLRPGEKLYEEKLMAEEGLRMTDNKLIFIGCPIPFDTDEFLMSLESLMLAAYSNRKDIKQRVAAIVNTYHPEGIPSMVKDGRYQPLEVGDRNLKTEEGKQR